MANIALIDLPADTLGSLAEQHTVRVYKTRWNDGQEDLNLADGTHLVFIIADHRDISSLALHTAVDQMWRGVVDRGGAVFVFVGQHCTPHHIRNLVGIPTNLQIAGTPQIPAQCFVDDPSPLDVVFSRFCNRIISSTHVYAPDYPGNPYKTREILKHASNVPTALLVEKGIGRCAYLPNFGDAVGLVVQTILRDVLPALLPHLVDDPQFRWLNQTPYLMPPLARIRMEQEEAMRAHEEAQHRLKEQWTTEWASTQTPWNELLTSTGDALKKAVQLALETLGVRVVDVDEYWKARDDERQKEEDLWLGFGAE